MNASANSRDTDQEISLWQVVFKQKEMENKFQEHQIHNRSKRNVWFAIFIGGYAILQIFYEGMVVENSKMPSKFFTFYTINIVLCSLYLLINQLFPKWFSFYHWIYMFTYALNLSWSVYDPDFLVFDPKKNFSFGFNTAILLCGNSEGGKFISKSIMYSVLLFACVASDQIPSGTLRFPSVFRTILPIGFFLLKIHHEEFIQREIFLQKIKLEDMMSIVNKQIPTPFIVAKFNKKESTMRFHTGNLQADKQLGVYNQATYEAFMENCYLIKQQSSFQQKLTNPTDLNSPSLQSDSSKQYNNSNNNNNNNNNFYSNSHKPTALPFPNQMYPDDNYFEQVKHDPINTLKYYVRQKVELLLKSKKQPSTIPKNDKQLQQNSSSYSVSQPPTKTVLPQLIHPKRLSSTTSPMPNMAAFATGRQRIKSDFSRSQHPPLTPPSTMQQQQPQKVKINNSSSNSNLINSNAYNHPTGFKHRKPYAAEDTDDKPISLQRLTDDPNPLNSSPYTSPINSLPKDFPAIFSHNTFAGQSVDFNPAELIDDLLLDEDDISEFHNSEDRYNKNRNTSYQNKHSFISQLPENLPYSPETLNNNKTITQLTAMSSPPQLQPIRSQSSQAKKQSIIDPIKLQFGPTFQSLNPLEEQFSLASHRQKEQKSQIDYSERPIEVPNLMRELSDTSNQNLFLSSNFHRNENNSINNGTNVNMNSGQFFQSPHSLKKQNAKKFLKIGKDGQSNEEKVNIEYNQPNRQAQVPPRYSVRFRLFRTNEILVVFIVENEGFKNKYIQEKYKNSLLSNIRSRQQSLIQKNFQQVNSLLSNFNLSSQPTTSSNLAAFARNQQSLTELLACLLSMNLLHNTFKVFNEFLTKSETISTHFLQDETAQLGMARNKINLIQLLRSIATSLSCEARTPEKIILLPTEGDFSITSNAFLIKIMLFSILRYLTQHLNQQSSKITISLIEEESLNPNEFNDDFIDGGDFEAKPSIPKEECVRIRIKIPLYEDLHRILESRDLFIFNLESLLKDEFSGQYARQSTWLLRTSSFIISQLGPYAKFLVLKDIYNDSTTVSFLIYKNINVLSKQPQVYQKAKSAAGSFISEKPDSSFINSCIRKSSKGTPHQTKVSIQRQQQ